MDQEKNIAVIKSSSLKEGQSSPSFPLCREPWESYYILRRGILPCCHGSQPIAPMTEWATAWNSPQLQEIRFYLSQGKLSPYCLDSLSCPIVQKYLAKQKQESLLAHISPQQRPPLLKFINRLFFRIPGKLYRVFQSKKRKESLDVTKSS
jgi:hypothetical protein